MFFIKLYHFLFGYVIIRIIGEKPEKFINILMHLRVKFRGIERIEKIEKNSTENDNISEIRVKISSRYIKEKMLEDIALRTNTEYKIISKNGFRFLLERHKSRLGLYTGAVIGVALIYFSTFFIWDVQVSKSDYDNNTEIIEMLESLGCKPGVLKKNIDVIELQNRAVLMSNGKISWIAVNIKGTVANIEIKKRESAADIIDQTNPMNIVASKSGKIIYMEVYEGEQIAKKETTVEKGDLLISGAVDSEMLGMRIKHASGKIFAETTRTIEIIIPLNLSEKYYTGNKINKNNLNILGKNINLYLKKGISFKKYDKIKDINNIVLFDMIVLPVKFLTVIYKEFELKTVKIDENIAKDIAIFKINSIIDDRFHDENIVEINSRVYEYEITEDYYYLKCVVYCVENIAKEMPFESNIKTEN